jgi:hypothetical protein
MKSKIYKIFLPHVCDVTVWNETKKSQKKLLKNFNIFKSDDYTFRVTVCRQLTNQNKKNTFQS